MGQKGSSESQRERERERESEREKERERNHDAQNAIDTHDRYTRAPYGSTISRMWSSPIGPVTRSSTRRERTYRMLHILSCTFWADLEGLPIYQSRSPEKHKATTIGTWNWSPRLISGATSIC